MEKRLDLYQNKNKILNNWYNILLLFLIIACPSIYLKGSLINLFDVVFPLLVVIDILTFKASNYKFNKTIEIFFIYLLVCLFSILVATIMQSQLKFDAILKFIRLLYVPIVYMNVYSHFNTEDKNFLLKCIMLFGIITSCIGIALFLVQSTIYRPVQTFVFGGKVLFRAGGIFAEPNTFAFMLILVAIVALTNLYFLKNAVLSITSLLFALAGIILSDTRSVIVALIIVLIFFFFKARLYRYKAALISILVGIVVFLVLCIKVDFLNRFIIERIMPIFSSSGNLNSISSGRIENWGNGLESFVDENFLIILFGKGYKVDNAIIDNYYLYALFFTGILGCTVFIWFSICCVRSIVFSSIRLDVTTICSLCFLSLFVMMFFNDTLTMSRPLYLIFTVFGMSEKCLKENGCTETYKSVGRKMIEV